MSQPRPSRALVIVNTDFRGSNGDVTFGTRNGAKREAEKLSTTLSQLNYQVKLMHNKTAKEIEDLYQQGTRPLNPLPSLSPALAHFPPRRDGAGPAVSLQSAAASTGSIS